MVKIERLTDGLATIERNGKRMKVYPGLLVTRAEIDTLVVERGKVLYSIDEQELVERSAPVAEPVTTSKKKIIFPESTK